MIVRLASRLLESRDGTAAAEMALVTPLLLLLLTGSVELGNYFMDEHILTKAVRDGARYAARQNFSSYTGCNGTAANVPTPNVTGSVNENTKTIVRKGSLDSNDADLLPKWTDTSTVFSVTMTCSTVAGSSGTTMAGIYIGNVTGTANVAPAVLVTAKLPYRPVLASFGFSGNGLFLNASQQAAVTGI